jgi:hypothetical protein
MASAVEFAHVLAATGTLLTTLLTNAMPWVGFGLPALVVITFKFVADIHLLFVYTATTLDNTGH